MTARNRLRKRIAQKAKVSTSSPPTRSYHSVRKEPRETCDAVPIYCATGNANRAEIDFHQHATSTTQTPSEKNAISSGYINSSCIGNSENCSITMTSTAATIDLKNNHVQAVVVSSTGVPPLITEAAVQPLQELGNCFILRYSLNAVQTQAIYFITNSFIIYLFYFIYTENI